MTKQRPCQFCGEIETLTGQGKFREDIGEYEWYSSDHDCPKRKEQLKSMAKDLGRLGGFATSKKYGKKHFSEAGKKGMAKRWGKKVEALERVNATK